VKTLNRYVGREVLYATTLIFVALLMLFAFFDLIHELANVGRDGYPPGRALLFVGLSLPGHVYELMPTAALIGTLFAIAQLVGNSEYTVMRASGASLTQITWAIVRVGVPLAIATFLAGEFLAPPAERLAQQVRVQTQGQAQRFVAQQFQSGFWFKQTLPDSNIQTFANIRSLLADMTLLGVRIYEFDADLRLRALRVGDSGSFVTDG
jgi:lipopolysaccharide export system permease protein